MGVVPYLCLLLSCLAGVRSDIVLRQPVSAAVKPGQSHTLTCAVSGFDISSYTMSWLKQVPGKGLEWLVAYYTESIKVYAPEVQSRFTASKNSSKFYLQMINLSPDDTATYYCARDTQRERRDRLGHKPSENACPSGAEGKTAVIATAVSGRFGDTSARPRNGRRVVSGNSREVLPDGWTEGLSGSL